ncbi:MAG: carbonic anhydrase [Leptolyngbyaceae cyanobacterium]
MKKLISGIRHFQSSYVPSRKTLMEELSKGQHPRVLFIACSDSRVDPAIITQSDIGDLFVIRNAGNIIPPYEATNGGEGATIEYAIEALDIDQVIICGHTSCGAMKGLLQIGELEDKMPLVYNWLRHTEATRKLIQDNYSHLSKEEMLEALVAENVLTQIENLRTYPAIRSKLYRGALSIYAWIYNIETGEILSYDAEQHAFTAPTGKTSSEGSYQAPYVSPQSHLPGATRLPREQSERIYRGTAVG